MKSARSVLRVILLTLELFMQCLVFIIVSSIYFFHFWLNDKNHFLATDEMLSIETMGDLIENPLDNTGAGVNMDNVETFSDTTIFLLEQWSCSIAAASGALTTAIFRFYFL